jgi:hypothetical protein
MFVYKGTNRVLSYSASILLMNLSFVYGIKFYALVLLKNRMHNEEIFPQRSMYVVEVLPLKRLIRVYLHEAQNCMSFKTLSFSLVLGKNGGAYLTT